MDHGTFNHRAVKTAHLEPVAVWLWKRWRRASAPEAAPLEAPVDDACPADVLSCLMAVDCRSESAMAAACGHVQQTRLHLEIEDSVSVPVTLTDQNAGVILELTQRARDHRGREKGSLAPVYNFGRETSCPGGAEW